MGFRTTTHDRCIYCKVVFGEPVFLLRQVDDILLASKDQKIAQNITNLICTKLQFETEKEEGILPIKFMGIVSDNIGIDINQTTDYIEMSSESYLKRLFRYQVSLQVFCECG